MALPYDQAQQRPQGPRPGQRPTSGVTTAVSRPAGERPTQQMQPPPGGFSMQHNPYDDPFKNQPPAAGGGTGTPGPAAPPPIDPQVAAQNAFNNYLNSTGYQFRFGQGMDAINSNAAARGMLNSGATLKGLQTFGQGIASQEYQNYLNQLSNMNNILGGTATAGQQQLGSVATAGTAGGGQAANAMIQGAANQGAALMHGGNAAAAGWQALGSGISNALGSFGGGSFW